MSFKRHPVYPVTFPATSHQLKHLKPGDVVEINGEIYVARDAAHRRFLATIKKNQTLPFPVKDALLYYMGPTPAPPGRVIGSCGPTTSSRMDTMTEPLLAQGLRATMGKGRRSSEIALACRRYQAIYLVSYGGCGAYLNQFVYHCQIVAYPELGPEAVYRLVVKKFPAVVVIDVRGKDLYQAEKEV
ncbi:MAG: FumA C-terminus/TtdB family hydratase beta subunit [Candidatus Omnitrophica bacterium]|nr:FumA C-terminus/TtdB family hydratase beta subunit [Candidatus Omnitrophota bacterium]